MPTVSAPNLVRLRRQRHATLLRLAVYRPAEMWRAQVDGLQTTGATPITVKNIVQTKAPYVNAIVLFGTTAGANDIGEARYKSKVGSTLTVGAHNNPLANNTYITIKEELTPQAILPRILPANVQYEDFDEVYVDGNDKYPPLCLMGPPAVARIDAGTGLATVTFYSSSVPIAAGATLSSYLWTFPSGTPGTSATAGTSGAPVTVTWNTAGQYYVSLLVTDSNGKTHKGFRPVWIFDPEGTGGQQPYGESPGESVVISQSPECDVDGGGWSTELTVHGVADQTAFPDGAQVCLFADDWYGDERISLGGDYTGRENIVMVGYIRAGSVTRDWFSGTVVFKVDGIGKVLSNLFGRAANFKDSGSPTAWHQHKAMTCDKIAYHILSRRATISQIADCDLSTPSFQMKRVDLTQGTLFDQLSEVYRAVRSRIGSSRTGRIYARANPQLLPPASRTQPVTLLATYADLRGEILFADEIHEQVSARIDFMGFNYNGTDQQPIHSLAPPYPWVHGTVQTVDGVRANSQSQANEFAGYFEGLANNEWGNVELHWRGNYRVFDCFPTEPIELTIAANENKRGIVWTAQKFYPKRVAFNYENGHLEVDTLVERDVVGLPGVTGPYPPTQDQYGCCTLPGGTQSTMLQADCTAAGGIWSSTPCSPPPPPPPSPYGCCQFPDGTRGTRTQADCIAEGGAWLGASPCSPVWPDGPETGGWRSKIYIATSLKGVFYTSNFTGPAGAMPTWSAVNTGLPVTTLFDMRPDPWRPSYRQYVLTDENVGLAPGGGYYYNRVYRRVGGGAWTQVLQPSDLNTLFGFGSGLFALHIDAIDTDINIDGYVGVGFGIQLSGNWKSYYAFSLDYGATWQKLDATGFGSMVNSSVQRFQMGYFKGASAQAAGQVLFMGVYSLGALTTNSLQKSLDQGATWTQVRADLDWEIVGIGPDTYQDNVYAWADSTTGFFTPYGLYRSTDQGANFTLLLNDLVRASAGGYNPRYRCHFMYPGDGAKATTLRACVGSVPGNDPTKLYKSIDAGATWPTQNSFPASTSNGGDNVIIQGLSLVDDADGKIYFLGNGGAGSEHHIYVSDDEGVTVYGKAGNDRSSASITGIPKDAGVLRHILQVWDV